MKTNKCWRLADLVDYEFFLDADERNPGDLHVRDRALYLDEIARALPLNGIKPESGAILRQWVDARRQEKRREDGALEVLLPGETFEEVKAAVSGGLMLLVAVFGWFAAQAALAYSAGSEPINAFVFFVEFAATQIVVLAVAVMVLAVRWWFPHWRIPSLMRLCLRVAFGLGGALWLWLRERIPGARRQSAQALLGVLRARHRLYRGVLLWSLVQMTQLLTISFNGGVLGAMTARHLFHDLDFGWESTWLDTDQVARSTKIIAQPWSWAVHPGYPNAPQVDGSQNLKRGAWRLDAESLKSWSQFLFGAVICYGLLPRLILLLLAVRAQRSILRQLTFSDGRSTLTLRRLLTPIVVTTGQIDQASPSRVPPEVRTTETVPPPVSSASKAPGRQPVLILNLTGRSLDSREVAAAYPLTEGRAVTIFPADLITRGDEHISLSLQAFSEPGADVVALLPAWMPPMVAGKLSLDQLRSSLGGDRLITLSLVGKPLANGLFKPVGPMERQLWVKAIQARADPYLCVPANQ